MKKFILLSALSMLIANSALANSASQNSENFAGTSIAIGLSSVGTHSRFTTHSNSQNSDYSYGENEFIGVLNASYLKDISEKLLIGVGVTYDLNPLKNKSAHFYDVALGEYKTTIKSDEHFSIYAQPTYSLNESTSLFAKIAYHETKIKIQDNFNYVINDYKKTLNGVGFGAGAIIFLDKNIFTRFEIEFVDYSKINIPASPRNVRYQLSTTSGTFSIGYRF